MTTKVKSSATSRKGRKVSKVSANEKQGVKMSFAPDVLPKKELNEVTAAAVAGASSHAVSVAVGAGLASAASLPGGRASVVVSDLMDGTDIKLIEFRSRVASNWAAPEWSGASAFRALLAGSGLSEEQINAAVAAAGRKSGENLEAVAPSINEVCEYINANFASEFKTLCGCSVPAASYVRLYSLSNLSLSTITADSDIKDYLIVSAVPAGLSASSAVAAVMSIRFLVAVRRAFAAARAAARNDFKTCMAAAARRAGRLGLSSVVAARYFSYLLNAVPASDEREEKRLRKNLASCWVRLRACENSIILAAPAGAFGAIEDSCGGWCFPASLPASAPAKVRKLWAKRVRLLSDIATLEGLLTRC